MRRKQAIQNSVQNAAQVNIDTPIFLAVAGKPKRCRIAKFNF
jgi:hypothetical protein